MTIPMTKIDELQAAVEDLRLRLAEAEETIEAIRTGAVDALVVEAAEGIRVYSLIGADHLYRVLVETMNEGAVTVAEDGTIAYCNCRFAALAQKPLERVNGSKLAEHIAVRDVPTVEALLAVARQGQSKGELSLLTETGKELPVMFSCVGIDLDGIAGVSIVVTDLTERKRKEEELSEAVAKLQDEMAQRSVAEDILRKNEILLRTVLETLPVGVAIFDLEGVVSYRNPAIAEIWGERRDAGLADFAECRILEHCTEESVAPEHYPPLGVLKTGETVRGKVFDIITFNGERKTIISSAAAIRNAGGMITASVGVIQDITSRQELQSQLLQSQKMETVGRLAGGIAHDFNNLLMVMTGFAAEALEITGETAVAEVLQHVVEAGERAKELTHKLLTFSRQQAMQTQLLDIGVAVDGIMRLLRRLVEENIEVQCTVSPDFMTVRGDLGQIEQVITNVVVNARDAMPDGGVLKLSVYRQAVVKGAAGLLGLERPGQYAVIEVSDTGTGIAENDIHRIFDPFFTTKDLGKGTGLGLSIAYGIVKQHMGAITVASSPGVGTVFRIYLPLVELKADEFKEAEPVAQTEGTETILVVEDDPTVLLYVRMILQRGNYNVIEATNGKEAVMIVEQANDKIDVVISDIMMPSMTGVELYAALKAIKPDLGMILMSGYSADTVPVGLTDEIIFLQKPVSKTMLHSAIREALDRSHRK